MDKEKAKEMYGEDVGEKMAIFINGLSAEFEGMIDDIISEVTAKLTAGEGGVPTNLVTSAWSTALSRELARQAAVGLTASICTAIFSKHAGVIPQEEVDKAKVKFDHLVSDMMAVTQQEIKNCFSSAWGEFVKFAANPDMRTEALRQYSQKLARKAGVSAAMEEKEQCQTH